MQELRNIGGVLFNPRDRPPESRLSVPQGLPGKLVQDLMASGIEEIRELGCSPGVGD